MSLPVQPVDRALREPTEAGPRLWVGWLVLASVGLWSGFFGPIQVLLAQQSEAVSPDHKEAVLSLVTGVGALVSTVLNPLWGAFSDRTTLRSGRRRPWVLGGAGGGAVAMLLLSGADSVWQLVLAWALAQACLNAIEYLTKFGFTRSQAYAILGTAPVEGHISGIVDIPNACATLWLPTGIFDFDIRPNKTGPTVQTFSADLAKAS